MNNIKTVLLAFLLLAGLGATAQTDDSNITQGDMEGVDTVIDRTKGLQLLVRACGDSVILRWATPDAGLWMTAKNYGWMLYRISPRDPDTAYALDRRGDTIPYVALNGGKPIKPMTLEEMMQRFDSTDYYAGVGAQALYGQFEYNVNEQSQRANADFMTLAAKQYQEQTQRHFMAMLAAECDPRVAEAIGLRYVDRDVKPGESYEYMLQCMVPPQMIDVEEPDIVVYNSYYSRELDEMIPDIHVVQVDELHAVVRWAKNKLSGYWLERRDDKDTNWMAVNPEAPLWPMMPDSATYKALGDSIAEWMKTDVIYIDSLDLDKTYTYRVRAFDAFGINIGPMEADPFRLEDVIPPTPPYIEGIQTIQNRICKITWSKGYMEDDFKGYMVVFSNNVDGPWRNISEMLSRTATSFTDSNAYDNGRGYYRVFVFDTLGNANYSVTVLNHIEDVTPPSAPTGLKSQVEDSTGVILLTWNDNPEPDVIGYRVYAANQKDHEFIETANGYLGEPFYFDTVSLKTLTRYIYYYVVAVDNNYNTSKHSDTLTVRRPDHIAPSECVLESIRQEGDSVLVSWHSSSSDDVAAYYIYRKPKPTPNWECVGKVTADQVEHGGLVFFIDTPEPSVHPYDYCIEVRDSAANSSGMAGHAVIQLTPDNTVEMNIALKAKYKKGKTTLTWKYKYDGKKDYYGVVYRKDGEGDFRDIGTFSRKDASYVDTKAPAKSKCTYYVQLQLGRGRHSTPSNQVTVKTK